MSTASAVVLGTVLLGVVAVAVGLQGVFWNGDFLHDDAFITLRYAQNWIAGNGIGWNPGDRVEGYTNFLQLLLVSGQGVLGVDLVQATHVVAGFAYTGLLALAASAARHASLASLPTVRRLCLASIPVAAIGASLPLIGWCFGGLEAPLFALLVTLGVAGVHAVLFSHSERAGAHLAVSGVALGLACLTRLDAGLFVAVAIVFLFLASPGPKRSRRVMAFALPVVVLLVPWLAWKLFYYGDLLPNTWWVKGVEPSVWRIGAGVRYLSAFLFEPPFPVLFMIAGAIRAARAGHLTRAERFGLTVVGLHLAWVVYVGGDQMPLYRLLVPILPLAVWLAWSSWLPDLRRLGDSGLVMVTVGVAAGVALQTVSPGLAGPHRNATSFVGAAVGRHIAASWRSGSLVALNTAGSTPYHSPGLRYLDMLGLNDAHIARRPVGTPRIAGQRLPGHAKGDGAYVLEQRPDYIILGPAAGVPAEHPWFLSDLEIRESPRFAREYALRREILDVRDLPGWQNYEETRSGALAFTYYQRRHPGYQRRRPGSEF